jgi:hypothetical protein
MSSITDLTAPSVQGGLIRRPEDLPHGLIRPPERVLELLAQEKAKFSPEIFTAEAEERILNQWVLGYYFDYLGHEVLYRQTPEGPEVLAVGVVEMIEFTKNMPLEEEMKLKTWIP